MSPAYCDVHATVAPQTDIQIQLPSNWQNRYLHLGGGGFDGMIKIMVAAANNVDLLAEGFVVSASNGGHRASNYPDATFAIDQTLVLAFAHTAIGETDRVAQAVIQAHYGAPARYRYFSGCSNGGKNASIAASLYRRNYDGVIGGDGAWGHSSDNVGGADMAGLTAVWKRAADAVSIFNSATLAAKLASLYRTQVAQCDGLDGLLDGIISNPSACRFDPASLTCPAGTDNTSCLTLAEVDAVTTGTSDLIRDGQVIGAPFGLGDLYDGGLGAYSTAGAVLGQGYLAMAYNNPTYALSSFNIQRDFPLLAQQLGPVDNMTGPLAEIASYVQGGGKLIVWTGGEDTLVPPAISARFVDRLLSVVGPASGDNVRLYMLPGANHCGIGGPGANAVDLLTPMVEWVERGAAPDTLVASRYSAGAVGGNAGQVVLTRPVCAYPKWPKYMGGNANDASSFTCVDP
jgi:feruloyl esterase